MKDALKRYWTFETDRFMKHPIFWSLAIAGCVVHIYYLHRQSRALKRLNDETFDLRWKD